MPPPPLVHLVSLTRDDQDRYFDEQLAETRMLGLFAVYSAADAVFMDDMNTRLRGRRSDSMVKRLRALKQRAERKGFRITLDHVLHEWRLARPLAKKDLDWLASELEHRHRLAHGAAALAPHTTRTRSPTDSRPSSPASA